MSRQKRSKIIFMDETYMTIRSLEVIKSKLPVKGNLVIWYKLAFAVCRKRDSKSI